jgi:hypothetical protein
MVVAVALAMSDAARGGDAVHCHFLQSRRRRHPPVAATPREAQSVVTGADVDPPGSAITTQGPSAALFGVRPSGGARASTSGARLSADMQVGRFDPVAQVRSES